jgi:hypothetical protein
MYKQADHETLPACKEQQHINSDQTWGKTKLQNNYDKFKEFKLLGAWINHKAKFT